MMSMPPHAPKEEFPMPADDKLPKQTDIEPVVNVEGELERIVFENPENGFLVGRLRVEEQLEPITFVGSMLAVSPGETLRLRGRWVDDKRFGKQLQVVSFETLQPETVQGIEKYLGSGLIAGIGPTYAKRLVEKFGRDTLRVISEEPHKLRRVEGIGKKRLAQIQEAWESQKSIQSIMVFLQGHGITPAQATKIYRRYGDNALAVLRANPYCLAEDIAGIAFRGADAIAAKLGIARDSEVRIAAGISYQLRQAAQEGHVFLKLGEVLEGAAAILELPETYVRERFELVLPACRVARDEDRIYLEYLYKAETECVKLLQRLRDTPIESIPITSFPNALKWAEKKFDIGLSVEQKQAIEQGIRQKVNIITGGPGTGKTTVINSLLAILERKGYSFLLAAPTGRAAKRMEAATGREAATIHRMLDFNPHRGRFERHAGNPLHTDLIVVDEVSMLDIQLMYQLLQAIPTFTRLILVGDVDQLPSVGPGNVLMDLIASQAFPVIRLNTIFRQASESGIIRGAHQINQGEYPEFNSEDFVFIQREDPEQAVDTVLELVQRRIPGRFGLDSLRDIQVLAPMRKGKAGINRLNEAMQASFNAEGRSIPRKNLRLGDKVMQLRNNYDLNVYNGDVGVITLLEEEAQEFEVTFDDNSRVLYSLEDADDLAPAYAATVHKSQGSEYPAVVLVLLPQHFMMLQRNLLYTAVTRGKQLVVIVGSAKAVGMAVRNSNYARRNSWLTERFRALP